MLRGFCSTTNPLCPILVGSPLYKVMLWKSAFCRYQSPEGGGCYAWGQFCAGGFPMAQRNSTGQKIWSWALFVSTVKVTVKAFEGQERENAYISATRPSIKILSTLFTIQLLILGAATPKTSKKVGIYGQKWQKSIIAAPSNLRNWRRNMQLSIFAIFGHKSLLFYVLGVAAPKIKSWIVKSVLRILIEGLVAEI